MHGLQQQVGRWDWAPWKPLICSLNIVGSLHHDSKSGFSVGPCRFYTLPSSGHEFCPLQAFISLPPLCPSFLSSLYLICHFPAQHTLKLFPCIFQDHQNRLFSCAILNSFWLVRSLSHGEPKGTLKLLGLPSAFTLASCSAYSTLMMGATRSSEISLDFRWTTCYYSLEDRTRHDHCCENLKSLVYSL
jgi:hypothetical protein